MPLELSLEGSSNLKECRAGVISRNARQGFVRTIVVFQFPI